MDKNIEKLAPQPLWKHFKEICNRPHPSKHEEKVRDYIVDFAKKNNIDYNVDKIGNIILRKPAVKGFENRKGLILQAHVDMVPQKNSDKKFDFLKDSIPAYIDGDWVTADGTTLGADDGIGVAAILAIFENATLKHGPLEALITIDEETGMTGAFGISNDELKGDILLNLDSETEGEMYVGCAGGIDVEGQIKYKEEETPKGYSPLKIDITGLKGGHSGMEIILQRGNSSKLLFRIINRLNEKFDIRISEATGGNMRNAIPREANATIVVAEAQVKEAIEEAKTVIAEIANELKAVEPNIAITIEPCRCKPKMVIDKKAQKVLIDSVEAVFNGIYRMSDSMIGLVETSSNMGIITKEKGFFSINFLVRSSTDSSKDDLCERIASVFKLSGSKVKFSGGYHGWQPNMDSAILKSVQTTYKKLFGKVPEIKGIHAGLECGVLVGPYPKWDMISFGPTICYPHSPDEKVLIASVDKFFKLLEAVVQDAPKK